MKNMLIKVLSVVMALTMIMGTCATMASAFSIVEHKCVFDEKVGHEEATCITPAYDIMQCDCGEKKMVAVGKKGECDPADLETVPASDATCETPGYLEYKRCRLCGKGTKAEDPAKPKLGHAWELVIDDPACATPGSIYDECSRCGETRGYSYNKLCVCEGVLVPHTTQQIAAGMCPKYTNVYERVPGCTSDCTGYPNCDDPTHTDYHACERAGHSFDEYIFEFIEKPTCTKDGLANFVCSVEGCDGGVMLTVKASGHNWFVIDPKVVAADCEKDGFVTYTCFYCGAVADAEHPELVEEVKAELRELLGLGADKAFPADVDVPGVIPATGHKMEAITVDANGEFCTCIYGYDFDPDGYDPVTNAIYPFKNATCLEKGYQWYHCVNADCAYGKSTSGKAVHYYEKEDTDYADHTYPVNADKKPLFTYTFYVYAATDFNHQGRATEVARTEAVSLAAAKEYFANNGYDFDNVWSCMAYIKCETLCVVCNEKVNVKDGGAASIPHNLEKRDPIFDEDYLDAGCLADIAHSKNDDCTSALCDKDATHWYQYECTRCKVIGNGYDGLSAKYPYNVDHTIELVCDLGCDNCVDCTHPGRKEICVVCMGAETVTAKTAPAGHVHDQAHLKLTEEKYVRYTHPDFGDIYATCLLPAMYAWVCPYAETLGCEHKEYHYDPADFTWDDGARWFDENGDKQLSWAEEVKYVRFDSAEDRYYYYTTENDFNNDTNAKIFCGDVKSRNTVTGHVPHAIVDESGNTVAPAYATGIEYVAPTCQSDGYAQGTCIWCGEYFRMEIKGGEAYHNMLVTPEIPATCQNTGVTEKSECIHPGCNFVKGGKVIPVDKSKEGHAAAGCTIDLSAAPAYTIYGTCSVPYTEVWVWSVCGQHYKVEKEFNPANHNKYTYDANYNVISSEWKVQTIALKTPTCVNPGNHEFSYCTECKYIYSVVAECVYDDCRGTADCGLTIETGACAKPDNGKYKHACTTLSTKVVYRDDNNNFANKTVVVDKNCQGEICKTHNDIKKYFENIDPVTMSTLAATIPADKTVGTAWLMGADVSPEGVEAYYAANTRLSEVGDEKFTFKADEKYKELKVKNTISDTVLDIAALGHDFYFDASALRIGGNIYRVYLKETCTTPGHEWAIGCTRGCVDKDGNPVLHSELNGETILPHGLDKVKRNDREIVATCTEGAAITGERAGLYCELCDAEDDWMKVNKVDAASHGQNCEICMGTTYKYTKAHNFVLTVDTKDYACDYGITFYRCVDCEFMYGGNYVPAQPHVLAKDANGKLLVDTENPDCINAGYKYNYCSVAGCDYIEIIETIPALGHRNIEVNDTTIGGDFISFDCVNDEYEIYKGEDCDVCNHAAVAVYPDDYKIPALRGQVICGVQNANIDHTWVVAIDAEANCLVDGGIMYICADCGIKQENGVHSFAYCQNCGIYEKLHDEYGCKNWKAVATDTCECGMAKAAAVEAKKGHDFGYTDEYVPATPEKNGSWTWVCERCGDKITEVIEYRHDIEFTLTVNPYIAGKTNDESNVINFVNGGQVEVILSVKAEYYNFNTIQHVLHFNDTKFDFVELEYLYTFDQPYNKVNKDNVKVSGWFDFDELSIVDGDEIALVRYIFDIAPGVDSITAADFAHNENEIDVSSVYTENELHVSIVYTCQTVAIEAVGSFDAYVAHVLACKDAKCENALHTRHFVLMGDVNGNGEYDIQDVKRFKDQLLHEGCDGVECRHEDMHDEYNKYNNVFDINYDGVVDMEDYTVFAFFQHSDKTVADYYEMFHADIASIIEAEMAVAGDQDGDKDFDAQDILLWQAVVGAVLASNWDVAVDNNYGDFTGYFAK